MGGLIARDPASDTSGKENYVFNVVGYRNGYLSVETKTTRDNHSEVVGPKWNSGDAELRICRLNEHFLVLKRHLGDARWRLADRYRRRDMPASLQVGPIAYTYTDQQNLQVFYDGVAFAPVRTEQDCYAR
ncbi:MAG TPA: hypothetical protein ENK23_08070 [Sorangium sp.]|nr:hypothetical protein [Sorangium sp.]